MIPSLDTGSRQKRAVSGKVQFPPPKQKPTMRVMVPQRDSKVLGDNGDARKVAWSCNTDFVAANRQPSTMPIGVSASTLAASDNPIQPRPSDGKFFSDCGLKVRACLAESEGTSHAENAAGAPFSHRTEDAFRTGDFDRGSRNRSKSPFLRPRRNFASAMETIEAPGQRTPHAPRRSDIGRASQERRVLSQLLVHIGKVCSPGSC